jgi:methionyl-tRNA formyltransferase
VRITLLANRDLPANRVADALLRALPDHEFSLVLSSSVGRPGPRPPALRELAVAEQRLPYELLDALLTAPAQTRLRSWRELAAVVEGRMHELDRPRSAAGRDLLARLAPELILSVRYGGILDAAHAALAPHGVLNLHSGRLPDYRGVLATFRALRAGDARLACTLHRIVDTGIDTGPIIAQAEIDAAPERSVFWNVMRLYDPGIELLVEAVERIAAGEALPGVPQDTSAGAYYGVPDAEELAVAEAQGLRLVTLEDMLAIGRELFLPEPTP